MNHQRNSLKAGIFISVSILLIFAVVVSIRGLGHFIEPRQQRTVHFALKDDVGGLRIGDDVRVGGFKVGEVRDIAVVPPDRIVVRFTMPRRFELRDKYVISIQSTVTGQSWLNFESLGEPTGAMVPADQPLTGQAGAMNRVISGLAGIVTELHDKTMPAVTQAALDLQTRAVPGMNQIIEDVRQQTIPQVHQTVASYKAAADTATAFISELRGYVAPVVERYYAVADSAKAMMDEVRSLFGDTKSDFRTTVANLSAATGTVKQSLPEIMQRVSDVLVKVDGAVTSAGEAMEDVKQTAENARDITASARSLVVGNKSKLDSMIASLKTTGDNLKAASAEIRRSPWRLLYKPSPGELANLNLYDSARQFAEGATGLNDAAQALRDALQDRQADAQHIQRLLDRLVKSFENFVAVEEKLWEQVKD